jgi:hypothetical protein
MVPRPGGMHDAGQAGGTAAVHGTTAEGRRIVTPPVVHFDWDAFQRRVERLRLEQDARTQDEAAAVSLAAFKRWRVRPPASFTTHDHAARRGADDPREA